MMEYLVIKWKWAINPQRHGGILNACAKWRSKSDGYMHVITWKRQSFGDSKKMSVCPGCGEEGRWIDVAQRIFRKWNYSVWYSNGVMMNSYSLYIYQDPLNIYKEEEWTLRDFSGSQVAKTPNARGSGFDLWSGN